MVIGTSAQVATAVGPHATLTAVGCTDLGNGQTVCTSSGLSGGALTALLLFYFAIAIVFLVAEIKIVTKAGYSGWWVLSTFVPILNVIMFLVFAFRKWPVQSQVDRLRVPVGYLGRSGMTPGYPGATGPWNATSPDQPSPSPRSGTDLPPFGQGSQPGPTGATGPEPGTSSSPATPSAAPRPQPSAQAPAGWYPTPDGRRRYWNGTEWTDHFA